MTVQSLPSDFAFKSDGPTEVIPKIVIISHCGRAQKPYHFKEVYKKYAMTVNAFQTENILPRSK